MRLLGNARVRRFYEAPMPLEVAPGRAVWERYRGQRYLVFIDESFFEFFGFDNPAGNFCHGALGIPAETYECLQRRLAPLIRGFERQTQQHLGFIPDEIKSVILRRLPLRFQARFVRELANALVDYGGFISGFYTPTDGFIMEKVRENLINQMDAVPDDHRDLYDAARRELLTAMAGPGQADLISRLLFLPAAAIKFMLGAFDCRFHIQYDPRQREEDVAVRNTIGVAMNHLLNLPQPLRQPRNYDGMNTDQRSEDELGLQLADVVAGQVRDFFRNDPEALVLGSTSRLITDTSDERVQKFEIVDGTLFKAASLHPMSPRLRRILTRRNMANLVSYFYPVLSSGILTCNTSNGQERDLEPSTGLILDLLD